MSTKIYNGLRIHSPDDLKGLRDRLRILANESMLPKAKEQLAQMLGKQYACQSDMLIYKNEQVPDDLCDTLRKKMDEQIDEMIKTRSRDPFVDMSADLVIFPTEDPTLYLGIAFAENKEIRNLVENLDGVEPYPYWNNTDEPEGMSLEDWEKRGKEWDAALGDDGVPAKNGFTISLIEEGYSPWLTDAEIMAALPSIENRKRELIQQLVIEKASEKIPESTKLSAWINGLRKFRESEEGKLYMEDLSVEIDRMFERNRSLFKLTR